MVHIKREIAVAIAYVEYSLIGIDIKYKILDITFMYLTLDKNMFTLFIFSYFS